MSEFRVQEEGFQIVLDNDYTVSVQFGKYHYCSNRHGVRRDSTYTDGVQVLSCGLVCSSNAEVAVIDPDGKFVALSEHDDVLGYQSVSEVISLIRRFNLL